MKKLDSFPTSLLSDSTIRRKVKGSIGREPFNLKPLLEKIFALRNDIWIRYLPVSGETFDRGYPFNIGSIRVKSRSLKEHSDDHIRSHSFTGSEGSCVEITYVF